MKKSGIVLGIVAGLLLTAGGLSVHAQEISDPFIEEGIVPCGHTDPDTNTVPNPCDFGDFIQLVNRFLTFLIFASIPIAVIMFTYAGFLLVTAAGSEGKIKLARTIFTNTIVGFIFVASAWVIVYLITSNLVKEDNATLDEIFKP